MTALFGLAPHQSGTVRIHGKPVRIQRPSDAIRNHMIYVSEDRRRMEIVACRNIQENVTMANLGKYFENFHWNARLEEREAAQACDRMRVKASSYKDSVMSLSGGNQQKVVLAKWLLCQPDILLMDEPTRGIDVGAKRAIYEQLTDFAREGKAIVLISSELPELIGMCDRIYVMCEGRITGCLERESFFAGNDHALRHRPRAPGLIGADRTVRFINGREMRCPGRLRTGGPLGECSANSVF